MARIVQCDPPPHFFIKPFLAAADRSKSVQPCCLRHFHSISLGIVELHMQVQMIIMLASIRALSLRSPDLIFPSRHVDKSYSAGGSCERSNLRPKCLVGGRFIFVRWHVVESIFSQRNLDHSKWCALNSLLRAWRRCLGIEPRHKQCNALRKYSRETKDRRASRLISLSDQYLLSYDALLVLLRVRKWWCLLCNHQAIQTPTRSKFLIEVLTIEEYL